MTTLGSTKNILADHHVIKSTNSIKVEENDE